MTFREELEIILNELLKTMIELMEISFEKTDYIVNKQLEELNQLTQKEEGSINKMEIIENARIWLLDTWGVGEDTPISDIIEKLPDDNSELIDIKDKMTKIFEELNTRNKLNNDLIRENLEWIDFNMNLMTSTPVEPSYGNENGETKSNSIFDRKV